MTFRELWSHESGFNPGSSADVLIANMVNKRCRPKREYFNGTTCINAAAVMFTHSDGPVIKIKSRKWSNNKSTQMNRPNNDAWQRGGGRGHWQHYKIENVSEFDWTVDSFAPTSWFWSQTLKITLYYVRIDECCHDESLVVGWGGWKGWRAQSARD